MKLFRNLFATLFAVIVGFAFITQDGAKAAGTYYISCTNTAYGVQHGTAYTKQFYYYIAEGDGVYRPVFDPNNADFGNYVGKDCLYAGAAKTNGTHVVAGDVARSAVNAIVGSVSNRIDQAYAAAGSNGTGTGLTFTNNDSGLGMAANKIFGGLSIWGDYYTSDFENTQNFVSVRADTNRYQGDSNSWSIGIDKNFGNMLIGIVVSEHDADLDTEFNDGTYKQDTETYGVYIAYRTSRLTVDFGVGTGDATIETTRRDLGTDKGITGSTEADITYNHARVSANFTKGRFAIVPRVAYRYIDVDIKAFTESVPSSVTDSVKNDWNLWNTGANYDDSSDVDVAGKGVSSSIAEIGVRVSGNMGSLVPYLDVSYHNESTSDGAFDAESSYDDQTEQTPSNGDSSLHIGAGINFGLGSRFSGGINIGTISGRTDYEESYASGGLAIRF